MPSPLIDPLYPGGAAGLAEHRRTVQLTPRSAEQGARRTVGGTRRAPCRPRASRKSQSVPAYPTPRRPGAAASGRGRVQSAARPSTAERVASAPRRAGISRRARRGATRRSPATGRATAAGRSSAGTPVTTGRPGRLGKHGAPRPAEVVTPRKPTPVVVVIGQLAARCDRSWPPMRSHPSARSLGTNSQHIRPSPIGWLLTTNGRLTDVK